MRMGYPRSFRRSAVVETETVLWQSWWWFGAVMLLLALEWALRKRAGMM